MPKKHKHSHFASIKPTSTPHPSLESSQSNTKHRDRHHGRSNASAEHRSVNDLIQHLRRTQIAKPEPVAPGAASPSPPPRLAVPRTVHPSLRHILEVPETPPPRPRPDARSSSTPLMRRVRRTPGPPPPTSWLQGRSTSRFMATERGAGEEQNGSSNVAGSEGRIILRLDRLPGVTFPSRRSLQHLLLKSMARNWAWHVDYDGHFLAELPSRLRMLLLSYVGMYYDHHGGYSREPGFEPLFAGEHVPVAEPEITRLDLSRGLGRYTSLRQLSTQLFLPSDRTRTSATAKSPEQDIPDSWDAETDSEDDAEVDAPSTQILRRSPGQKLRFENLRYLSLAHPAPGSANWSSLISLLSQISTITHLSLAHWPVPSMAPTYSIHARLPPTVGADMNSALENNWSEATSVLRRLSRTTYCLKWLDLEGCSAWFGALSWDGVTASGEVVQRQPWPDWNGAWRDVEWVGLGPGWTLEHCSPDGDVDEERKQRLKKEKRAYEEALAKARDVERFVRNIRREGKGKWIQFSFGLDAM